MKRIQHHNLFPAVQGTLALLLSVQLPLNALAQGQNTPLGNSSGQAVPATTAPSSRPLTGPSSMPTPVAPPRAMPAHALGKKDAVPFLQDDQYILGPGDGLVMKFLGLAGNDPLSGPLEILSDGTASAPLVGSVRLTGLTLSQATLWLQSLYRKQVLRPELQLTLTKPRPLRVAILGEVEHPGIYTLNLGGDSANTAVAAGFSGLPTLIDAIQKAGGITNQADLTKVNIRRQMPGETALYRRTSVDLLALIRDGDLSQNPLLFDGDTIRVTKAPETIPEAIELSATTLAPKQISVNVIGEVKSPGAISLPANTPLVQAVLSAGGTDPLRADKSRVQLIRMNRNGSITRRAFYLSLDQGASNESNPPLRDRDTLIITRSNYAKLTDAFNAIATPLNGLANILALSQILRNTGN